MPTVTASATTATTCACCGTLSAATLQCRIRGGAATLCGFSEFTAASTPPKKYRVNTIAEEFVWCTWGNSSCAGDAARFQLILNGDASYSNTTCALTNATLQQRNDTGTCGTPGGSFSSEGRSRMVFDSAFMVLDTDTAVLREASARPPCYNFTSGAYVTATGSGSETLSDEDTNQDAINRLLAGAGGTWGVWTAAGATGCTGTPPSCCLARWEERTSDFDFIYQEAQYRVIAGGLNPSTTYNARVEIYRSVFGASSFSLFQTLIISGTTDGSGNFQEDGDVPNEEGYESYAAFAYIVIPS